MRDRLRWAREHIYALVVLGPLVLGMSYLTLAQAASYDLKLSEPPLLLQLILAAAFVLGTMAVSLSRASRELYHLRSASGFTEALPVSRAGHLHFALSIRAGHTAMLGVALLLVHSVLGKESVTIPALLSLLVFCALVSVSEVYSAVNWIHWGHVRGKLGAVKAIAVSIMSTMMSSLLLVIFFNEAAALQRLTEILRLPARPWTLSIIYAASTALALVIYLLARSSHDAWRARDVDYAQRLEHRSWPELKLPEPVRSRFSRAVCALLLRDLSLSLRVFSSMVYVAATVSLLIILLLVSLLLTGALPTVEEALGGLSDLGWVSATWFPSSLAIKTATLLVVACLASIVPVLVSHQIPHAWLERAVGATANDLWLAKLWYARLLTLPAVVAVYLTGALAALLGGTPLPLSYLLPLLAECLWLWWLASSIIGALAFEMPDRPGLALVLVLSLSVSIGMLSVVLWPMGLGFYGMGVEQVKDRGIMQTAQYLLAEEM